MSDSQEFYGPTVEAAVAKAAASLGITEGELDFEVLDQGSAGFLGIGARDARILVRERYPRAGSVAAAVGDTQPPEDAGAEGVLPVEEPTSSARLAEDPGALPVEAPLDLIVAVDEFMTALVQAMGFDATIDAYDAGDAITVDVVLKETGLFIGQKGETIDSVQYLLNVAMYKNRAFVKRIVVDCEGYRRRRVEAIQGMAHRAARRAVRERRPRSLPPMAAAERRVVHLFLKDNPDVTTFSDGEEEDRRVIVAPV